MDESISTNKAILNKNIIYADWGTRLAAWLIDFMIIFVVQSFILNPLFISIGLLPDISLQVKELMEMAKSSDPDALQEVQQAYLAFVKSYFLPLFLIDMVVQGAYYIFMESSSRQATIGKTAMGIVVTDNDGNQLTPFRAAGRYFAKYISKAICYIGFLFPLFTPKKQALHDMLSGCLVVKRKKEENN